MEPFQISIAKDFVATPGPRYIREGDNSGELFRRTILFPRFQTALAEKRKLVVNLDGTAGYGTSFLEEAFGGLIREEKMEYSTIVDNLTIISSEEDYLVEDVFHYLKDAETFRVNGQKK